MTNSFINAMRDDSWTLTENGRPAKTSTGNHLLDLYGIIGALRTRPQDVVDLFERAYQEDPLHALKLSFYARDIRGGLGERLVPNLIWYWLANHKPEVMGKNLVHVPTFGRWDDMYTFVETPLASNMWRIIFRQLSSDLENMSQGNPISLLAKWLKSENASSKRSRALGRLTANRLGLRVNAYRKMLSEMRAYLKVVEVYMSSGKWTGINYSAVPSKAMANYRKAFGKHDPEGFGNFITSVENGEEKINSQTLFPYDIFKKMGLSWDRSQSYSRGGQVNVFYFDTPDRVLEAQWKALPNYVSGKNNVLVIADTSGSMEGGSHVQSPICSSIGLGVYFAERNSGDFKDLLITFSSRPSFVDVSGDTLEKKISRIPSLVDNTDIEAVFKLILDRAVVHKVPQEDMPKTLVIISDMEFDESLSGSEPRLFHDEMEENYARHGYELPVVVYWNVDSRQNVFHANSTQPGVMMASGQSPSVFKSILENIGKNAYEAMISVLDAERYNCITL